MYGPWQRPGLAEECVHGWYTGGLPVEEPFYLYTVLFERLDRNQRGYVAAWADCCGSTTAVGAPQELS